MSVSYRYNYRPKLKTCQLVTDITRPKLKTCQLVTDITRP